MKSIALSTLKLGPLSIDMRDYASQGNAILGIRDSGKSYTATYLAERMLDCGIPFTAFDPIGLWRFLRVPGKGKGYPVVVAGGEHGDLPLTLASAPEIVRAAMREGVSLVLDLYSLELSKADWKRIVQQCVRVMLYENKGHGLRHVFIEEAAEFCPQRVGPDQGQVYAEVEKLARMGGNALLGYTLINQRAEEVNKAVLELCDGMFLHRQKGRNSLVALGKWLDVAGAKGGKDLVESLPELPQGECWAWPAGTTVPVRIKVPAKSTFHPDRRAMRDGIATASQKAVDVGAFVQQLSGSLAKHLEEAKANDPADLRRQLAEANRKLAAGGAYLKADVDHAFNQGRTEGYQQGAHDEFERWKAKLNVAAGDLRIASGALSRLDTILERRNDPAERPDAAPPRSAPQPVQPQRATTTPRRVDPTPGGSGPQQRILDALAELEAIGATTAAREQVAFLAGYSHTNSKGFTNGLGSLRSAGEIDYPQQGQVCLTDAGRAKANTKGVPLIGLLEGATARVLQPLIDAYPNSLPRDALAAAANYGHMNSKGFTNALGRLRSLGFIDYPGPGQVVALPVLFLERR
jgi:hypothetical protein